MYQPPARPFFFCVLETPFISLQEVCGCPGTPPSPYHFVELSAVVDSDHAQVLGQPAQAGEEPTTTARRDRKPRLPGVSVALHPVPQGGLK